MLLVNAFLIPLNRGMATFYSEVSPELASAPVISFVTPILPVLNQTVHIYGGGFGNTFPTTISLGDGSFDTVQSTTTPSMVIIDTAGGSHEWSAGMDSSSFFDLIGIVLVSWNDTEIVLGGFGHSLGTDESGTWNIKPGDPIEIRVYTANGNSGYNLAVSSGSQSGIAGPNWSMFRGNAPHTGRSLYVGSQLGSLSWMFNSSSAFHSSPAVGLDGTIYVGSDNGKVYAVNADGSAKWNYTTGGPVSSSPAISSDGTIYVGSNDGKVYALNANGSLKWSYSTISPVVSSPAIDPTSGVIYVSSTYDSSAHGRTYAFFPNGTLKWVFNPGTSGSWIYSSPAVRDDGAILFGDYTNPNVIFWALSPNGTSIWHTTIPFGGENDIYSSAAVDSSGQIYFGEGHSGNRLVCLSSNGTIAWYYATGGPITSSPALGSDGTVYFGSSDGKFYAVSSKGVLKWAYPIGAAVSSSPAVGSDGLVYVGANDGKIYAFYSDGTLKWTYKTAGAVDGSPAIGVNGRLYVSSSDGGLYAFQTVMSDALFTLSTKVENSTSNIFNATVSVGGQIVASDSLGYATFLLPTGSYTVTSSFPGYPLASSDVDLDRNLSIILNLGSPYVFKGTIPDANIIIGSAASGYNISVLNMFPSSSADVFFDWKFVGTLTGGGWKSFSFSQLPELIVIAGSKGSADYPQAYYRNQLPPILNVTTGREGALLPESVPYAAESIFVNPYPPVKGQIVTVGVNLHNPFNGTITINQINFQVSGLTIGGFFSSIGYVSNVSLTANESRLISIQWNATLSGHHCIKVVLSYADPPTIALPESQVLQRNLEIEDNLLFGTIGEVPFTFTNPLPIPSNITVIVTPSPIPVVYSPSISNPVPTSVPIPLPTLTAPAGYPSGIPLISLPGTPILLLALSINGRNYDPSSAITIPNIPAGGTLTATLKVTAIPGATLNSLADKIIGNAQIGIEGYINNQLIGGIRKDATITARNETTLPTPTAVPPTPTPATTVPPTPTASPQNTTNPETGELTVVITKSPDQDVYVMPCGIAFEAIASGGEGPYAFSWAITPDNSFFDSKDSVAYAIFKHQGDYHIGVAVSDSKNNLASAVVEVKVLPSNYEAFLVYSNGAKDLFPFITIADGNNLNQAGVVLSDGQAVLSTNVGIGLNIPKYVYDAIGGSMPWYDIAVTSPSVYTADNHLIQCNTAGGTGVTATYRGVSSPSELLGVPLTIAASSNGWAITSDLVELLVSGFGLATELAALGQPEGPLLKTIVQDTVTALGQNFIQTILQFLDSHAELESKIKAIMQTIVNEIKEVTLKVVVSVAAKELVKTMSDQGNFAKAAASFTSQVVTLFTALVAFNHFSDTYIITDLKPLLSVIVDPSTTLYAMLSSSQSKVGYQNGEWLNTGNNSGFSHTDILNGTHSNVYGLNVPVDTDIYEANLLLASPSETTMPYEVLLHWANQTYVLNGTLSGQQSRSFSVTISGSSLKVEPVSESPLSTQVSYIILSIVAVTSVALVLTKIRVKLKRFFHVHKQEVDHPLQMV